MAEVRRLRELESDAQSTILELARWRRWEAYHTHDSRRSRSGFPDLALWRDRLLFAELKRVGARPRPDQVRVLDGLARAGAEVYLWTLDDLGEIGRILERGWAFVAYGDDVAAVSAPLQGPRLVDGKTVIAPRSAWIPGQGRRDGA